MYFYVDQRAIKCELLVWKFCGISFAVRHIMCIPITWCFPTLHLWFVLMSAPRAFYSIICIFFKFSQDVKMLAYGPIDVYNAGVFNIQSCWRHVPFDDVSFTPSVDSWEDRANLTLWQIHVVCSYSIFTLTFPWTVTLVTFLWMKRCHKTARLENNM